MQDKIYKLRYLPLFEQDLLDTVTYISKVLKNEEAAMRLINDVETEILARLNNPVAFEPYHSRKKREYPYYRIYVRNYVIYYVVIDDVKYPLQYMESGVWTTTINQYCMGQEI